MPGGGGGRGIGGNRGGGENEGVSIQEVAEELKYQGFGFEPVDTLEVRADAGQATPVD